MLALTVLDRFGLRLTSSYSVNPATMAMYGLVAALLVTRHAQINVVSALLYVGAVTLACTSFVVNMTFGTRQLTSLGSLMLLCVLYAPFVFALRNGPHAGSMWRWMMRWYVIFMAVLAVFGVTQYFAQFVVRLPWLIDFTDYIPTAIRGSGVYNTSNVIGSAFKSNGFFLREASGFSMYMAIALVCEWELARRKSLLALFGLAVVVTYSGSGMLILIVALALPLGWQTFSRAVIAGLAIGLVVLLFGDALNLSYTLGRVGEFNAEGSSAYCRFVAPAKLVVEQIESDPWVALLGHGPGTTQKMSAVCETTYGKVLFEYGMVGALLFSALILFALARPWIPLRLRSALAVNWYLLGGNLLGPESLLMIFFLSAMWPSRLPEKFVLSTARPDDAVRGRGAVQKNERPRDGG
ncbi:hypothetical protein ASF44_06470 [Pseudorhodoferax sp. Leaf274]|nr:hypothetical protein ASF44_06470 [Pseudorhodoferax sp. Leaf274]